MKELPIEINSRINIFSKILFGKYGLDASNEDDLKIGMGISMLNKIVFYNDYPLSSVAFKVDTIEKFKQMLDDKWGNKQVFSIYSAFLSPSIHNMDNFKSDKLLMVRDNFIDVDDNFQLKDIIDRNRQIDNIIS